MSTGLLERRIQNLKKQDQQRRARVAEESWYRLLATPSCPPTTTLYIRGGLVMNAIQGEFVLTDYGRHWPQSEQAYQVPDLTFDVAGTYTRPLWDGGGGFYMQDGYAISFSNAHYYQACTLNLNFPAVVENPTLGDWSFQLYGLGDEFETAGEAEAFLLWDTMFSGPWYNSDLPSPELKFHGLPLCGLILKNTGITGTGQVLPVDKVNRGRSYIFPSDIRPRWFWQ